MMPRAAHSLLLTGFALAFTAASVNGAEPDSTQVAAAGASGLGTAPVAQTAAPSRDGRLIYLVPELESARYTISDDRDRFRHRISFSPGVGRLGAHDLYSFRASYSPNTWLGYEVAFGHNPAQGLHALLHTFNVHLRYPLPWRAQPYGTLGYGMMTVYPGQAINADPVTKNALTYGGGLEFYIRDDVALRGELRGATVFGQELDRDGTVAYEYREYTIGFSFYRTSGQIARAPRSAPPSGAAKRGDDKENTMRPQQLDGPTFTRHLRSWAGSAPFALLLFGGCRDSAPDDVIVQEETTDAIVFVKTRARRRSTAAGPRATSTSCRPYLARRSGNTDHQLHRGEHQRSVRIARRQEDPLLDAPPGRRQPQHL